ncbi:MAG: HupE/UreJ family protein [Planctomycetaceae bacterium]
MQQTATSHIKSSPRFLDSRRWCVLASAILILGWISPRTAPAHHLDYTLAITSFDRDAVFEMSLQFHVAAYVLDEEPSVFSADTIQRVREMSDADLQSKIDAAIERLAGSVEIEIDGRATSPAQVVFPTVDEIRADALATEPQPAPPVLVRGELDGAARAFRVVFPPRLGKVMLMLESNGAPTNIQILRPGEQSWPHLVDGELADNVSGVPRWLQVTWAYLRLGFEHILPKGSDHILFVLGLFLLNQKWRPLVAQITAFTVAHSVTLGLSMYDVVSLPSNIVEPIIALSIAYVAIENICTTELKPWRTGVVFLFGLLHGLGFAGVLREFGVPSEDSLLVLVSFNVGVELGQLTVIGLALLAVGWCRERKWFRQVVVVPASCLIAFVGVYWTAARIL